MKICHVCAAECPDDAELCPLCGAELKAEDEYKAQPEEIIIEHPVLAVSVEDVVTGEIYRDVLKENGIPFTTDEPGQDASIKIVFGGSLVAEDIYVDESNLETALRLYDDILNAEPEFIEDFDEDNNGDELQDEFGES